MLKGYKVGCIDYDGILYGCDDDYVIFCNVHSLKLLLYIVLQKVAAHQLLTTS